MQEITATNTSSDQHSYTSDSTPTSDSNTAIIITKTLRGVAFFLGQQLDLKAFEMSERLASDPLVVKSGHQGYAVLFPYGAAVLFGLEPVEEAALLTQLESLVSGRFETPETEEIQLKFEPTATGRVDNGTLWLQAFSVEHLQIVADVLAKSVVLSHYEASTARIFGQIEPFADGLQRSIKTERWGKELLRQLGRNLSIQNKIVGRVEIIDKPELLWDSPELERLYLRLEDEYEIRERHLALEKKLELIARTAETVLELLQHNSTLRVEWYIVALIVIEILLSLYELFLQ